MVNSHQTQPGIITNIPIILVIDKSTNHLDAMMSIISHAKRIVGIGRHTCHSTCSAVVVERERENGDTIIESTA